MKKIIRLFVFCMIFLLVQGVVTAANSLEVVAESPYQWTGIAVSQEQRIFVNFPTWKDYPEFKVGEVKDGQVVPYPSQAIQKQFICVQSVVVDSRNHLWILDPAKLRGQVVDASGAKLFEVDLDSNELLHTYVIPAQAMEPNSYLNDVRIDNAKQLAYMADSQVGGIVVLDLKSGEAWRALDKTVPEVLSNLPGIDFPSTGLWAKQGQSDGIELSAHGDTLYFMALSGDALYAIPTAVLRSKNLTMAARRKAIQVLNTGKPASDGMVLKDHYLYMADLQHEGLWVFNLYTGRGETLSLPQNLRWADSFAVAPDGSVYFTTSQINYSENGREKYKIYHLQ